MSKELRAFRRFRDNIRWLQENTSLKYYFENSELHFKEDLDTIETALKDYEDIKPTIDLIDNGKLLMFDEKQYEQINKNNLALEIIKKKMVSLDDLNDAIYEDNYHQNNEHNAIDIYNQNRFEYKQLTKEEFDILKEVLL